MAYEWTPPTEACVPLSAIAKKVGVRYETVLEWAIKGRKGVQLRVCQLTSGMGTSMDEYRDFLERLNEAVES